MLVSATLAAVLGFVPVGLLTQVVLEMAKAPLVSDSYGSDSVVRDLEERASQYSGPSQTYVAAVANQMAGRTERARELLGSIEQDPRSRAALAALDTGSPLPPLSTAEFHRAYTDLPLRERLASLWRWPSLQESIDVSPWKSSFVAAVAAVDLMVFLVLALAMLVIRPRGELPTRRPHADIIHALASFSLVVILVHLWFVVRVGIPAAGPLTAATAGSLLGPFPKPPVSYWAHLSAYPLLPGFLGLALLAGLAAAQLVVRNRKTRSVSGPGAGAPRRSAA
jgi:hypothetical protein